jgi:hypothetical protein
MGCDELRARGGNDSLLSCSSPNLQLLDFTAYNQPWWVVFDPKQPGTNSSVLMPMKDWACNYLLGIAQV